MLMLGYIQDAVAALNVPKVYNLSKSQEPTLGSDTATLPHLTVQRVLGLGVYTAPYYTVSWVSTRL